MSIARTCAGLVATAALAGCTTAGHASPVASTSQHVPLTGHVTGRFVMEGGPISPNGQQPGERPIPGTVTLTAAGRPTVTIQVGSSGKFSAWLPPGRYQVSGRTPDIEQATSAQAGSGASQGVERPCSQPLTVTITGLQTATITLTCIVP